MAEWSAEITVDPELVPLLERFDSERYPAFSDDDLLAALFGGAGRH